LLDCTVKATEILIMKRDADILSKIALANKNPFIAVPLIPYMSLFCNEVSIYGKNNGYPFELTNDSMFSMNDIRQKTKFFNQRMSRTLKIIRHIDILQNKQYINTMRYPTLGNKNFHDNLGIYFDTDKNIIGNTHYAYYVFQDLKLICSEKCLQIEPYIPPEELKQYAKFLGSFISKISSSFSVFGDFVGGALSSDKLNVVTKDFNTNRMNFNQKDDHSKLINLFLLYILCGVNFSLFCLKIIILRDSGWLLRIEFITYYYAIMELNKIKALPQTAQFPGLTKMLSEINLDEKILNQEFRNCMMHYGLTSNIGEPLIKESYCDWSLPMCGLVESLYNGLSYWDLQAKIEDRLLSISQLISRYLNID